MISQQVRLVDGEVNIDGVNLIDFGQERELAGPHQVARVHQAPVDAAVEGGHHPGVVQIQLGQVPGRLGRFHGGQGGVPLEPPVVQVRLGRGFLLHQLGIAVGFDDGVIVIGFLLQDLRLGLRQLSLIGIVLNQEEQLALFHHVAVLKKDLLQKTLHPGLSCTVLIAWVLPVNSR